MSEFHYYHFVKKILFLGVVYTDIVVMTISFKITVFVMHILVHIDEIKNFAYAALWESKSVTQVHIFLHFTSGKEMIDLDKEHKDR